MKAINNFESVQATTGEFSRPTAGGYVIKILDVFDVPLDANDKGNYLRIDYDIADGEFANYYTEQNKRWGGDWYTNFIRSYKEKALGMFKHFINCVEESNKGFSWDWNEKALIGKRVGVVLREEEYIKNDGSVGSSLKVYSVKTVKQIEDGDFDVPAKKPAENVQSAQPTAATNRPFVVIESDEDLPF